jgi:Kef-type K+ transport system membrane component KefB
MPSPLTHLLFQILLIVCMSRVVASVLRIFGQPHVIGEMLAGIILGKSILGVMSPEFYGKLFPANGMERLYLLSQLGLIFFMFVVGLELETESLKKRSKTALLISQVSIALPFALGTILSFFLYDIYAPAKVPFASFTLFMGIAMSITAFPVLARILQEKKLTKTTMGTMAISCAAVDDVTAWLMLAIVVGLAKGGTVIESLPSIGMTILYVIIMVKGVRPMLENFLSVEDDADLQSSQVAFLFLVLLGSALVTELIGIHALFGAFMAGLSMPQNTAWRHQLINRVESVSSVVLLPIFFAFTGIRTEIGLLNTPQDWGVCLLIILAAILGKLGGSTAAARWSKFSWRESLSIGVLMNTRGLMELVILNIGYDLGILSPKIFSMMVIMALVTTMMTGPLIELLKKKR